MEFEVNRVLGEDGAVQVLEFEAQTESGKEVSYARLLTHDNETNLHITSGDKPFSGTLTSTIKQFVESIGPVVEHSESESIYFQVIDSAEQTFQILKKLRELGVFKQAETDQLCAHVQQFEEDFLREQVEERKAALEAQIKAEEAALEALQKSRDSLPAGASQELTRIRTQRQSIHADSYTIKPKRFAGPGQGRSLA